MKDLLREILPPNIFTKIAFSEDGGCWEWSASHTTNGYAQGYPPAKPRSRPVHVHRYVMQMLGYDLAGLDVDHLCRNRGCVNPEHLEPVTRAVNLQRARGGWCKKLLHDLRVPGSSYPRKNGRKLCRECVKAKARERYESKARPIMDGEANGLVVNGRGPSITVLKGHWG